MFMRPEFLRHASAKRFVLALTVFSAFSFPSIATADITGFNNGTGWTANNNGGDAATFGTDSVTLTDNMGGSANSVFYNTAQSVTGAFTATFDYTVPANGGPAPGDGFAFVIQNSGLNAIGFGGFGMGYGGITSSASVQFNLWPYNGGGLGTNYFTGGNVGGFDSPGYIPVDPVELSSGDTIHIVLQYDPIGQTLTESLLDTSTMDSFSTTFTTVDIATAAGGPTAFVGFTGGDGLGTSTQVVSNFTFAATSSVPEPACLTLLVSGVPIVVLMSRRAARLRSRKDA